MPSPFPGMNPWIEHPSVWHGFHHLYLSLLHRQIVKQIAPRYLVEIDDNVYIQNPSDETIGWFRPDIGVAIAEIWSRTRETAVAEIEAPVQLPLIQELEERLSYLKILDGDGQQLITVVELLSPTNKRRGENRSAYLDKRRSIHAADVNLVEIDFLRGDPPMPPPERPACDYSVLVVRAYRRSLAGFWPIGLREPLPIVPVPLREGEADARLDLKAALDEVYDDAAYQYRIYRREPEPPLSPEDRAWAAGFLTAAT